MGSYGDRWLRCAECGRWGKCMLPENLPPDVPSLIDIDGVGVVCDPCLEVRPKLIVRWLKRRFTQGISAHIESYWHRAEDDQR